MTCIICDTKFYAGHTCAGPGEPCDCGWELPKANVEDWDRVKALRERWLASQKDDAVSWPPADGEPACEDCGSITRVTDRKAGSVWEEKDNEEWMCPGCADRANERAYEASLSDYYGGGGTSQQQRDIEALKLK